MDLTSFKRKIEALRSTASSKYVKQYNDFWTWKISVEQNRHEHILDAQHLDDTCYKLLEILPRWQTYRGLKCNYEKGLPTALHQIQEAYSQIRQYSLLEFNQVPEEPLMTMWDACGRVKEIPGVTQSDLNYFIIAVCKPLMFLWGQTLAFDSINRKNIRNDHSLRLTSTLSTATRWTYSNWKTIMLDFQKELLEKPEIIEYCRQHYFSIFGSNSIIPYGRYLDIYYYY